MNENRKLVLDTETTGLNVENGDRIIEIGIVELIDKIKTGNNYQIYINPERKIEKSAQKIHGLSNDFLDKKPKFHEIANELISYISNSTLIIHNAEFDIKFLDFELENCGYNKLSNNVEDTMLMARKEYPGQSVSLDSLCRKLKIDRSARSRHGALLDADLLSSVYIEMTSGKQAFLNFDKNMQQDLSKGSKNALTQNLRLDRKSINYLPKEEYQNHIKFIETIDHSLWEQLNKD